MLSGATTVPTGPELAAAVAAQLAATGPWYPPEADPEDLELVARLHDTFLDLLPARAAALRDARDPVALAAAAHGLAGCAAQFGYPGLGLVCRELHRRVRAGEGGHGLVATVVRLAEHVHTTSR